MMLPKFCPHVSNHPWVIARQRDPSTHGSEGKRVDIDTERGHVLLLKLASQMTLDKGGLDCNAAELVNVNGHPKKKPEKKKRQSKICRPDTRYRDTTRQEAESRSRFVCLFPCPPLARSTSGVATTTFSLGQILTLPVPPSPTSTSLKVGGPC